MNLTDVAIGYMASGGDSGSGKTPKSNRYSFFVYNSEDEVLNDVKEEYSKLYKEPPKIVGFNENILGEKNLELRVEKKGFMGRIKEERNFSRSITMDNFLNEQLVKIKLFDDEMKPISENIMIARYLKNKYQKK
ncbi:hypothetical protein GW931_02650 [archaeon]|nr:hypothetical protein [archaeon]